MLLVPCDIFGRGTGIMRPSAADLVFDPTLAYCSAPGPEAAAGAVKRRPYVVGVPALRHLRRQTPLVHYGGQD